MLSFNEKDPWGKKRQEQASREIQARLMSNQGVNPKNKNEKMKTREPKKSTEVKLLPYGMKVLTRLTNLTITEKVSNIVLMRDDDSMIVPVFEVMGYGKNTENCQVGDLVVIGNMNATMIDVGMKNKYFEETYDSAFKNKHNMAAIITENSIIGLVKEEDCREMTEVEIKSLTGKR